MLKEKIEAVSALLKSISNPVRLNILCLLQDKEMTVGELRDALETTDANISQHLTILRNQGIVQSRKESNFIFNRIGDERVLKLIDKLQDLFC